MSITHSVFISVLEQSMRGYKGLADSIFIFSKKQHCNLLATKSLLTKQSKPKKSHQKMKQKTEVSRINDEK